MWGTLPYSSLKLEPTTLLLAFALCSCLRSIPRGWWAPFEAYSCKVASSSFHSFRPRSSVRTHVACLPSCQALTRIEPRIRKVMYSFYLLFGQNIYHHCHNNDFNRWTHVSWNCRSPLDVEPWTDREIPRCCQTSIPDLGANAVSSSSALKRKLKTVKRLDEIQIKRLVVWTHYIMLHLYIGNNISTCVNFYSQFNWKFMLRRITGKGTFN